MAGTHPLTAAVVLLVVASGPGLAAGALVTNESGDEYGPFSRTEGPDHGVNESTYPRLWSDDADNGSLSMDDFDEGTVPSRAEFVRRLARSTDIPFDRPPAVVEQWNDGDLADFEPGDDNHAVHPAGASLDDGRFIRDAGVNIFAVQPSTISHEG